jgi:hypothetical protein
MVYVIYGIICIKDTYVVCKYVKKTVLELGLMGFMGFNLPQVLAQLSGDGVHV